MRKEMISTENQDHSDERKLKLGYRLSIFGGDDVSKELPEYLTDDESFEPALEQITTFLRAWVKAGDAGLETESWRSFSLSLVGPMEQFTRDRRSLEQKLSEAETVEDRVSALIESAKESFEAGEFEEARGHLLALSPLLPDLDPDSDPHYYLAQSEILRGRLALIDGDVAVAKRHLREAAIGDGSPVMCSFGPNMSLAHDLLLIGERQSVLEYFDACRHFWKNDHEQLDVWEMYVREDRIPDFGANLIY